MTTCSCGRIFINPSTLEEHLEHTRHMPRRDRVFTPSPQALPVGLDRHAYHKCGMCEAVFVGDDALARHKCAVREMLDEQERADAIQEVIRQNYNEFEKNK
jgi:hypothetical protein